jgi:hypothetical protein
MTEDMTIFADVFIRFPVNHAKRRDCLCLALSVDGPRKTRVQKRYINAVHAYSMEAAVPPSLVLVLKIS